jgi:hypothetical protein
MRVDDGAADREAQPYSAGLSRVKGVEDERAEPASRTLKSLLAGKIQGILSISPVGSSQMAQNIVRITIPYEKISGALEQGNFGSHQGIELGNQLLSGKELSLAFVGISLKENEMWLVMKALGNRPDTGKCGRCLTLPISRQRIALCR